MEFIWEDHTVKTIEFGTIVRGLNRNGIRPLNCRIRAYEFDRVQELREPLSIYLRQVQDVLAVGGRVVIV